MHHNGPAEGPVTVYRNISAGDYATQYNGPMYGSVSHGETKKPHELILDQLKYEGMYTYRERPLEAYSGTYEWLLQDEQNWEYAEPPLGQNERECASRLQNWLRNANDIFWIAGKPGSGKSTLVRCIARHDRTRQLLEEWAGREVLIAKYFAWKAGSALEKSWPGFLRSLLHQLIAADSSLVMNLLQGPGRPVTSSRASWTAPQLLDMLKALLRNNSGKAFVFFIDGLDEFDCQHSTDHLSLVQLIKSLHELDNVKICVASRADNVFRAAFGCRMASSRDHQSKSFAGDPALALHSINARDIDTLVSHELLETPILQDACYDAQLLGWISTTIKTMADGVFLWATLAVRSVRRGLLAGDSHEVLEDRVRAFPPEVEDFIASIYHRIEPVYQRMTAQLLLLLRSIASREILGINFLPVYHLPFLEHYAMGRHSALRAEPQPQGLTAFPGDLILKGRLIAAKYAGDLVLCATPGGDAVDTAWSDLESSVRLAHRTILDFIDKAHMKLVEEAVSSFHPALALLECNVQLVRLFPTMFSISVLTGVVPCAKVLAQRHSPHFDVVARLLLEVDRIGGLSPEAQTGHWAAGVFSNSAHVPRIADLPAQEMCMEAEGWPCDLWLAAWLLSHDLDAVFWHLLEADVAQAPEPFRLFFLECSLIPVHYQWSRWGKGIDIETTTRLLRVVPDVNRELLRTSLDPYGVWQVWMYRLARDLTPPHNQPHEHRWAAILDWSHALAITRDFLERGASLNIRSGRHFESESELYDAIARPETPCTECDQNKHNLAEVCIRYERRLSLRALLDEYAHAEASEGVKQTQETQCSDSDCSPGCKFVSCTMV